MTSGAICFFEIPTHVSSAFQTNSDAIFCSCIVTASNSHSNHFLIFRDALFPIIVLAGV
jgi:hypothetical protein